MVLVRQFRLPAYLNGHDDLLIEAAAGLLDDETPEERIRAEAEEETGYRLRRRAQGVRSLHEPGAVTEKLHFFVAEYEPRCASAAAAASPTKARTSRCWSCRSTQALAMIADGRIADAKTIMLLQYAALYIFTQVSTHRFVGRMLKRERNPHGGW